MRHLPVIADGRDIVDRIEIPVPCTVPWDSMRGDEAVRHCGECKQNVYNLASFTRAEAVQLLTERSGRVCLRIFRRPDGTVLTSDCRARLRAARRRGLLAFAGVALVILWAQICAQIVGWMGLRAFLRGPTHGGPVPAPITEIAPPPLVPLPPPLTGEPIRMGEVGAPPPVVRKLMHGKPAWRKPEIKAEPHFVLGRMPVPAKDPF
jgi:hypothetical protein